MASYFKTCLACRKWKWRISRKPFISKALKTTLTPENEICNKCRNFYQNITKPYGN